MRRVEVSATTIISKQKLWSYITDLNRYPRHVKFVKKVNYDRPLSLGSTFSDITTIALVPIKITHTVDIFQKEKILGFYVNMPLTGFMKQRVKIMETKEGNQLKLSIEFDFQNKLFDIIFGRFLEKRVREMLLYILDSEKYLNAK